MANLSVFELENLVIVASPSIKLNFQVKVLFIKSAIIVYSFKYNLFFITIGIPNKELYCNLLMIVI